MPYEIKTLAGQPYVPSNGDEGRRFMARFCAHCIRDTDKDCPVLFNALAGTEPPEWRHNFEGKPECSAYKPITFDEERKRDEL